ARSWTQALRVGCSRSDALTDLGLVYLLARELAQAATLRHCNIRRDRLARSSVRAVDGREVIARAALLEPSDGLLTFHLVRAEAVGRRLQQNEHPAGQHQHAQPADDPPHSLAHARNCTLDRSSAQACKRLPKPQAQMA